MSRHQPPAGIPSGRPIVRTGAPSPSRAESLEIQAWIRENLHLPGDLESELIARIEEALVRQQRLWQESKNDALEALCEGFGEKMERLQRELTAKDATVSSIARYFEELVADLTEKSRRDPKTKLMNFDWFMERVEAFLAAEQRVRWCAVGVVDITAFKWYNDNLGHPVGDRIIECVASLLNEQIRSEDLLAQERAAPRRDLHARFGGDEFCFLIPDLPGYDSGYLIAERFKTAVERYDWSTEDPGLAARPIKVDVGVVCLRLGSVGERRRIARRLAEELIQRADQLMYGSKSTRSSHVTGIAVRLERGELVEFTDRPAVAFRRRQG